MYYRQNPEIPISSLPTDISPEDTVEICFAPELTQIVDFIASGNNVLIECDKQLMMMFYMVLRSRLKERGVKAKYNSGQSVQKITCSTCQGTKKVDNARCSACGGRGKVDRQPPLPLLPSLVAEVTDWVRSAEEVVIVMPHLDLLTSRTGGLTDMAKEIIAILYENPEARILAFKDPAFMLPETLSRLFTIQFSLIGTPRDALPKLITQNEARKLGEGNFDPFHLYKYVSGINPIRLREILTLVLDNTRMDFDPRHPEAVEAIYRKIREITCESLEIPHVDLWTDIGGYDDVKERIQMDIIDMVKYLDTLDSVSEIKEIESLIPRGIILEGPPGTGKTFFAKAIATALNATVSVINGPEILSKWVGESEQNIRNVFEQARKSAPSIIIFDELDSIATARSASAEGGSSVRNTVVNQLLTELDGFRNDELVFVVGTTNFAESLDPALRRPGRFQLIIEVPYPNEADRTAILNIYNDKLKLGLSEKAINYLVRRTGGYFDPSTNARYAGDHLQSICQNLKRILVRKTIKGQEPVLTRADIDSVKLLRGDPEAQVTGVPNIDLWKDIGGYKNIKQTLQEEIIDQINYWKEMQDTPGIDPRELEEQEKIIPKGIILEGPPGTGKTFFAKALANAIGARAIVVNGPEIVSMWVGKSEENLRQIFAEARRDAPSVIIFDEMDSFAGQRTSSASDPGGAGRHANALVNQLLAELDGFQKNEMVFVIGTTNFAESLDNALKRPGRFEFILRVPYPKAEDRREIFQIYNKKFSLDLAEEQIDELVRRTGGYFDPDSRTRYSGDHIEGICRELRRIQLRKQRAGKDKTLTQNDIDKVKLLRDYTPPAISDTDLEAAAIHEAGHALVSAYLEDTPSPHRVTIEGDEDMITPFYTQFFEEQSITYSRRELVAYIAVMLAGKMTEELVLRKATTGITDDLMRASNVAREMVERFGMGRFKQSLYVYTDRGPQRRQLSAQQEAAIDVEVEDILAEAQDIVRQIIFAHQEELYALIEALIVEKELAWDEIKKILKITEGFGEKPKPDWRQIEMDLDIVESRRRWRRRQHKRKSRKLRRYY